MNAEMQIKKLKLELERSHLALEIMHIDRAELQRDLYYALEGYEHINQNFSEMAELEYQVQLTNIRNRELSEEITRARKMSDKAQAVVDRLAQEAKLKDLILDPEERMKFHEACETHKITAIKILREHTGMSLVATKKLCDDRFF